MDNHPRDWHDLASHNDMELDGRFRRSMIDNGIYFFPAAMKQCSISAVHTQADIDATIVAAGKALRATAPVMR